MFTVINGASDMTLNATSASRQKRFKMPNN